MEGTAFRPYSYGDCGNVLVCWHYSFQESVKNILSPETPSYSNVSMGSRAAVAVKATARKICKTVGNQDYLNHLSHREVMHYLILLSDFHTSSCRIYIVSGVSLEAYLGALIAVFIIKAGIDSAS